MPYVDPDNPNPKLIAELLRSYEESSFRLKKIVESFPTAGASSGQTFQHARASQLLAQVDAQIARLKKTAASWTGTALEDSIKRGLKEADRQLRESGVTPSDLPSGSFGLLDRRTVEILARDTVGDLVKAADAMGNGAATALRGMQALGVSKAEVNRILAGGVIEGKPAVAIRNLRAVLEKVHGAQITIHDKNGDPLTFDTKYYAELVARTKTREAVCKARHERLADEGYDLVTIIGRVSKNFCSAYLGKVFSLSGHDKRYPALSRLPGGGPPFHPNCSKSTAPFIQDLASKAAKKAAKPTAQEEAMLDENDTTALQRTFGEQHGAAAAADRQKSIVEDIRDRARAAGYAPPAYGTASMGVK